MARASSAVPLRRRLSWLTLVIFYVTLLLFTWVVYLGKFSNNVDQLLHDAWVRDSQRKPPSDVVIVAIDNTSLNTIGRWPWPRLVQTSLFSKLAKAGVQALAVDVLYVENDIDPVVDARLGEALSRIPNVVLPVLTSGETLSDSIEKLPVPEIIKHAQQLGHIYTPLDPDGLVRRVYLKSGYQSPHWPALGLALAHATGAIATDAELPGARLEHSEAGQWVQDHEALIPFYGRGGTFDTVSAVDVLGDQLPANYLRDKIVFFGSTAIGLGDMLATPVSGIDAPMAGVEIHANIFSMLRDGESVDQVDQRINFVVVAVLLAILLLLYSSLSPLWALVCLGLTTLAPIILSYVLYHAANLWYAPLTASIPILLSYFVWSWHRLEFVAEYLRSESDIISKDLVSSDPGDNARLVNFFDTALRHLPLDGWRFRASGEVYSGGESPAQVRLDVNSMEWSSSGDSYRKRFPTKGRLDISIKSRDVKFVREFTNYIESLSRIKDRPEPSRLTAPLERVQNHTYQLSQQLDRLRQVKVLSDSIFAGSPAGLLVWSASGELVTANALAVDMYTDINVSELTLIEFVEAVGRDPYRLDKSKVDNLILHKMPWQINQVGQDTELVINFNAVGETLADRLISASIVDVSDIRRSERSRAEMVDFLSHDLRSPLISALYMLKDIDPNDTKELNERFARVEGNINLSLSMMEELLNIARADNLSSDQFIQVLFDSIVSNAIDQMLPVARNRQITIEEIDTDEELWIECDASLMERAIVNVVSNAIKYSPDNTTVRLSTRKEQDQLVFRVADEGVGIAPEMMENLFQRFKRDKAISQQYKGIGLGLALVSKVVTEHGGSVRAESAGSAGTVIVITLPLASEDQLLAVV